MPCSKIEKNDPKQGGGGDAAFVSKWFYNWKDGTIAF